MDWRRQVRELIASPSAWRCAVVKLSRISPDKFSISCPTRRLVLGRSNVTSAIFLPPNGDDTILTEE